MAVQTVTTRSCPVLASSVRFPERAAVVFEGRTFSWREANALVSGWTRWLVSQGIGQGDRVATLSWNRPELVWLVFALGRLGAAMAPLNARLTKAEVTPLFQRSGARLLLGDEALAALAAGGASFRQFEDVSIDLSSRSTGDERVDLSTELAWLFTSGTTGTPTLVPLTCGNFFASHDANAGNLGASEHQRWLGTLPLFHVGGLAMVFRCAVMGACLLLERAFDAGRVASHLQSGQVTHASFVPTALGRVLDAATGSFPSSLEAILIGGGPMGATLLKRARALGLPVLQTYGLTEACSQVTTERLADADGTSAGPALPGLEVRVVDDRGDDVQRGVVGSVLVRGPTVTRLVNGWLSTNDLGSLDDRGRLTLHARRVDLILSGGENVYPAEIEAVLMESGLADDAGVVPLDDAVWGQVPVAVVVWRSGPRVDELVAFLRERLASFKLPRRVLTSSGLPRNANGKLVRESLRAWAAAEVA